MKLDQRQLNYLYKLAFSILKSKEDAEEVVQDAFVIYYKNINRVTNAYSFICSCVVNEAKSLYRNNDFIGSKKYYRADNVYMVMENHINKNNYLPTLETELYNKQIIHKYIDKLPKKQRKVAMAFFSESRKKDAADSIGYKENTFKAHFRFVALGYKQWLKDIA